MTPGRSRSFASLLVVTLAVVACDGAPAASRDPLAREIARGREELAQRADSSDFWQQVKGSSGPLLDRSEKALKGGWRLVALNRLGAARVNLDGYDFTMKFSKSAREDTAGFAAAWRSEGEALRKLPPASAERAAAIHPAAIRAMAETAIPQVRDLYDAALDYGYSTEPTFGFFYMGTARGQRAFFDLCAEMSEPERLPEPAFRSIAPEMDSLESDILAAYRPPFSIDRHPEFIGVSSALKEARELDAEGLHRGALFRYLYSVLRFAPLRPRATPLDSAKALRELDAFAARMKADGKDHSIARLYLETARAEQEGASESHPSPIAVAVAADVLPRYFAALEPAPPRAAAVPAEVRVTLVRWPYT